MQRLKRLLLSLGMLMWFVASGITGSAFAHDVQNSEVRAVFGENDRYGSVEVWQTMPLEIAYGAARTSFEQNEAGALLGDGDVLEIMGPQLLIAATTGQCDLTKQAHRRVHKGTRLQMRFLFVCPQDERPTQMIFAWMANTPSNHFVVLEQKSGHGSPFKVIERGNPVFTFERF